MEESPVITAKSTDWFAVYTRHQHEKSVAEALCGKEIENFLPLYNSAHRWKDRIKQVSLPLFPNYVFVFAPLEQSSFILATPGIYDFVRRGGWPASIPQEEVAAVRTAVEKGLNIEPHPFLKFGDRVRLRTGAMEGLEGILLRKKNSYRLVISVELLARSISLEVDAVDVDRVFEKTSRFEPSPTTASVPRVCL